MTFPLVNTLAQVSHFSAAPDAAQIIIILPQVTYALSPNTAAPQIAIGRKLATGPAGVTRDHLALFVKGLFGQLVIFSPEGLGNFSKAFDRPGTRLFRQKISNGSIFLSHGGNFPADRI